MRFVLMPKCAITFRFHVICLILLLSKPVWGSYYAVQAQTFAETGSTLDLTWSDDWFSMYSIYIGPGLMALAHTSAVIELARLPIPKPKRYTDQRKRKGLVNMLSALVAWKLQEHLGNSDEQHLTWLALTFCRYLIAFIFDNTHVRISSD
jgi:hypothetical protein